MVCAKVSAGLASALTARVRQMSVFMTGSPSVNDGCCCVIDWRARYVAASAAEERRAEADRSDAGWNGRTTLTGAGFACRFALAGGARTRDVGTRAAFALLFEAGDLLCKDRADVGIRCIGHETQAVVFCLDQFLSDFRTVFFLGGCVRNDACRREHDHGQAQHITLIHFELLN